MAEERTVLCSNPRRLSTSHAWLHHAALCFLLAAQAVHVAQAQVSPAPRMNGG